LWDLIALQGDGCFDDPAVFGLYDTAITDYSAWLAEFAGYVGDLDLAALVYPDKQSAGDTLKGQAEAKLAAANGLKSPLCWLLYGYYEKMKGTLFPDIEVVKSADKNNVDPNGEVTFTFTITNKGPCTATDLGLIDFLPKGVDLISSSDCYTGDSGATASGFEFTRIYCPDLGDVPPGGKKEISLTVKVDPDYEEESFCNQANLQGNEIAGVHSNCVTTTVNQDVPVLTVEKTADPANALPGDSITYTITITNHGADDMTGSLTDTLPPGLQNATVSGDPACTVPASTVVVCSPMILAGGQSVTITIESTLNPNFSGDVVDNTAIANGTWIVNGAAVIKYDLSSVTTHVIGGSGGPGSPNPPDCTTCEKLMGELWALLAVPGSAIQDGFDLFNQGKYDDALTEFQDALKGYEDALALFPQILEACAFSEQMAQLIQDARDFLDKAIGSFREFVELAEQAFEKFKAGQTSSGNILWGKALDAYSDHNGHINPFYDLLEVDIPKLFGNHC
jgi:uncharacterized repeat protein (TIGR01451 family)